MIKRVAVDSSLSSNLTSSATPPANKSLRSNSLFPMGGQVPNYRFSKEKGREVSSLESTVDSIKRRISNSGERRRGRLRVETATNILPVSRFLFEVKRYHSIS
jgi:hypothetical protein